MKVISREPCLFISLVLTAFLLSSSVYSQFKQPIPKFDRNQIIPKFDVKSRVIFFVRPGVTPDSALRYLKIRDLKNLVNFKLVKFCPTCDSTLFTIEDFDYSTFNQYRTGSQQLNEKPKTTDQGTGATEDTIYQDVSGRLGPLSYIVDYRLTIPDEDEGSSFELSELTPLFKREPLIGRPNPVRIGVLDTGLDSTVAKYYKISQLKSCINKGEIGWNFINNSSNITDDYKINNKKRYHGLAVTSLIIQGANRSPDIDILPIKVLNGVGQGNLYEMMCGLAYAKSAGVKIVNISLGLYAANRRLLRGFEDYMKSLTDAGIIIVTAAGNAVEEEDTKAIKAGLAPADLRNIDKHPFYPAAFSDNNPNIISVTTVIHEPRSIASLKIMPRQNFSSTRVHIGVFADSSNGAFYLPGIKAFRNGSSFATPIITGQIAAIYKQISANGSQAINRESILRMMADKKMLFTNSFAERIIFNGYTGVHKK